LKPDPWNESLFEQTNFLAEVILAATNQRRLSQVLVMSITLTRDQLYQRV